MLCHLIPQTCVHLRTQRLEWQLVASFLQLPFLDEIYTPQQGDVIGDTPETFVIKFNGAGTKA